jgi:hypothetical protein
MGQTAPPSLISEAQAQKKDVAIHHEQQRPHGKPGYIASAGNYIYKIKIFNTNFELIHFIRFLYMCQIR